MRFFLLICFSLPCGFAQTNPMGYFYMGRYEEAIPDFAALAVLEKQNCPLDIDENEEDCKARYPNASELAWLNTKCRYVYFRNEKQLCTSRYRIIRVLDAASDAFRKKHLGKEYIEAKEKAVSPYFRHRPVLIFGRHKDGHLQIEGYEDMREYFGNRLCDWIDCQPIMEFSLFFGFYGDLYAFHSIGTPYYDVKNLDHADILYYNEYLASELKPRVNAAGKDFSELLLRLTRNRTPIKAAKIKNDFAAIGTIRDVHPAGDPKRPNLYELNVIIETVFKNDAKIDSSIAIFIDRDRLPLGWGCQPFDYYLWRRIAFYFFGNLRDGGSLIVDSLVSPLDAFIFGDTVYDISMGLPFEELISYFVPSNISIEELKFGERWKYLNFTAIRDGKISEKLASQPECVRNDIIKIAVKWEDYEDDYYKRRPREEPKVDWLDYRFPFLYTEELFRCRMKHTIGGVFLDGEKALLKEDSICRGSDLKNKGIWGRQWRHRQGYAERRIWEENYCS